MVFGVDLHFLRKHGMANNIGSVASAIERPKRKHEERDRNTERKEGHDINNRATNEKRIDRFRDQSERDRAKRIFGSLVDTLEGFREESTSYKARQNAELRAAADEKGKLKLERVDSEMAVLAEERQHEDTHRREQQAGEEKRKSKALALQHNKELAHFLKVATGTEERPLYYLPRVLRPVEEDIIAAQLRNLDEDVDMIG